MELPKIEDMLLRVHRELKHGKVRVSTGEHDTPYMKMLFDRVLYQENGTINHTD